jgi:hypothetical protein
MDTIKEISLVFALALCGTFLVVTLVLFIAKATSTTPNAQKQTALLQSIDNRLREIESRFGK